MAIVEAGDEAIRRLAHDRKYSDHVSGRDQARTRRFQPQRRYQQIAQRHQRLGPSRLTRHHALSGTPRVEIAILDFNAEGVGELRAGQQRTGVSRRGDLVDFHCNLSLFASERKRNSRKTA